MKNVFKITILALFLFGCSSAPNQQTVYPMEHLPKDTGLQPLPQYQYRQVIKSYPEPKTLEYEQRQFKVFSRFPETKIALLVPLSGKYAQLGKNIQDAAQLALFSVNEPNFELLPIDTKGTSYGALAAANTAIKQGADLILGPVFSSSASAIAQVARENNVSIISFSNDKSLAGTGVFAMGFRPEQQISRIVEFAMDQGIEDFTTIISNNNYGAVVAKELRETVAKNNQASVLKTQIFQTNSRGAPVKLKSHVWAAFEGIMNNKPPKDYDKELKAFNYNPIRFPRAMLIPEGGNTLEQISALLKKYKHNPSMVQLLGSEQWYNEKALNNPVLEGAWFASPPKERRERFNQRFEETYAYKPIKISSLAYDGIALAAAIIRITGNNEFSKEDIKNPRGFFGVDGIFRFSEDGLTERGLAIIRIKDGQFETIAPAPNNFVDVHENEETIEE